MTVRILHGDCLDVLKTLPDESVHCCVSSPPYWRQRDYGMAGQLGLEATPSCGAHGLMRLRRDLTEDQRRYAVQRLLGVVDSGALNGGRDGTE